MKSFQIQDCVRLFLGGSFFACKDVITYHRFGRDPSNVHHYRKFLSARFLLGHPTHYEALG
jgi:hypothetical protein